MLKKSKPILTAWENAIDIHYGITKFGYGWVFPKEKHFSVGVSGLLPSMKN